ncbi:NAD(+)/NADH kinase [Pseudomonas sp. MAFF 302030]|uniref:NAD(+)/NADH kinase n=1 Tax=Pseudomonas morbosilactucae TaxID=2938197 RepID=A0A9X2C8B6_9PSED|nr:NAD(+)/NADH kinase [Pseudomonas morbosilactucae]MCK9800288.1 NAD(+)/NADH kinase [Pseudomonas morbosilactucae]
MSRVISRPPLTVGIIANPASGRDVRRLTANAGLFSSTDKVSVIQRLLAAFGATGIERVLMPTDMTGIAAAVLKNSTSRQARDNHWPALEFLDLTLRQTVEDTRHAARWMAERGVSLIAVLGGDGTHKAVAAEVGDVPLLTLSTGTNNAFPELREATSAGLAGGLYASGRVPPEIALRRNKRLLVREPARGLCEVALVDVAVSPLAFVGARAISRGADLAEVFVTFAEPQSIGISALCGLWMPVTRQDPHGAWMRLDPNAPEALLVPLAPGLLQGCGVLDAGYLAPDVPQPLALASGTLALDGEREIEFNAHDRPTVTLDAGGPLSIDVNAVLAHAAQQRLLAIDRHHRQHPVNLQPQDTLENKNVDTLNH